MLRRREHSVAPARQLTSQASTESKDRSARPQSLKGPQRARESRALRTTPMSQPPTGENRTATRRLLLFSLAALGIVFGDIGTSPLYAMRECFHGPHGIVADRANVL